MCHTCRARLGWCSRCCAAQQIYCLGAVNHGAETFLRDTSLPFLLRESIRGETLVMMELDLQYEYVVTEVKRQKALQDAVAYGLESMVDVLEAMKTDS